MLDIENKEQLKLGFKQFLNERYGHLSHKDVICSDAFFLFRNDLGIDPKDVLTSTTGTDIYRDRLIEHFASKGRKNPKSDAYTYCRCVRLLKEYVMGQEEHLIILDLHKPVQRSRSNKIREDITRPSVEQVAKYLNLWDELENYRLQEEALDKLFYSTYPKNDLIEDVLIKVSTLNDFYSTNIFAAYKVAKHIIELQIDERLRNGDVSLVGDIAKVCMDNGRIKNFYSFATKYCSHHRPLDFPIYDSYVDVLLRYFRDVDAFFTFKNDDLKDYSYFKNILIQFRNFYGLNQFNLKEIDKYLWQLGKDKFPKNYGKAK